MGSLACLQVLQKTKRTGASATKWARWKGRLQKVRSLSRAPPCELVAPGITPTSWRVDAAAGGQPGVPAKLSLISQGHHEPTPQGPLDHGDVHQRARRVRA